MDEMDADCRGHGDCSFPTRRRSRSHLHNNHASLLPAPPRLARRQCMAIPRPLALLLLHAHRLVRHRGHPLLVLCALARRVPARCVDVDSLHDLLCAVSAGHHERVHADLRGDDSGIAEERNRGEYSVWDPGHLCSWLVHTLHAHDEAAKKGDALAQGQRRQVSVNASSGRTRARSWVTNCYHVLCTNISRKRRLGRVGSRGSMKFEVLPARHTRLTCSTRASPVVASCCRWKALK